MSVKRKNDYEFAFIEVTTKKQTVNYFQGIRKLL